jgi:hypothetical protein
MTPEQDAILRRLENELLGPRGPQGEIVGWTTALGPRTTVAMLVELVNGLLARRPPPRPLDTEGIKVAFAALPPDRSAALLAELIRIQQARRRESEWEQPGK